MPRIIDSRFEWCTSIEQRRLECPSEGWPRPCPKSRTANDTPVESVESMPTLRAAEDGYRGEIAAGTSRQRRGHHCQVPLVPSYLYRRQYATS
jgi:hypothetical protein